MKHDDFMKIVRKHNSTIRNPVSIGEEFRKRILHEVHTDDEWLELRDELMEFIASKPPQKELDKLQGCGEVLTMICNGNENGTDE